MVLQNINFDEQWPEIIQEYKGKRQKGTKKRVLLQNKTTLKVLMLTVYMTGKICETGE